MCIGIWKIQIKKYLNAVEKEGVLFGFSLGRGRGFILNNISVTEVKILTQKYRINYRSSYE